MSAVQKPTGDCDRRRTACPATGDLQRMGSGRGVATSSMTPSTKASDTSFAIGTSLFAWQIQMASGQGSFDYKSLWRQFPFKAFSD
jgi:hypothetical protein